MITVLTFWLCAFGHACDANHSAGTVITGELSGSVAKCDEIDALTNDPYLQAFLATGLAPRHTCVPKGEAI